MKKTVCIFVICLTIVSAIGMSILSHRYHRKVWVDSVNGNVVTFVDTAGEAWEYELDTDERETANCETWTKAILTMNNNNTEFDITDDLIVNIKWTEWK